MAEVQKQALQLAEVIRAARKERHLSQEDLALEIRHATRRKLTAGAISQIELGRIRPEIPTMDALAAVLGDDVTGTLEYQLAESRRQLDERLVGREVAEANLARVRAVLPIAPVGAAPPAPRVPAPQRVRGTRRALEARDSARKPRDKGARGGGG